MSAAASTWSGALSDWRLDPILMIAVAGAAGAYAVAAARSPRWPRLRTLAFMAGLAALVVALASGFAAGDGERLSFHMVEHLVLVTVAPPLLLLGAPLRLLLRTLPAEPRRAVARVLTARGVRLALHPFAAWLVFTAVLLGTHVPAFYEAALASAWLHGLEHALYFWSAVLVWESALRTFPMPAAPSAIGRMLLLMAAAPPMVLLGATLTGSADVIYGHYAEAATNATALADQQTAGAVMWLGGSLPMALALVVVGWVALVREEARAVAREHHAERRAAAGGGVS